MNSTDGRGPETPPDEGGFPGELQRLKAENARLRAEVSFLRGHPTIARGLRGESLMAGFTSAIRSKPGSAHDLEAVNGLLFEVKYSSLLTAIAGKATRRWAWTKIFGELGQKRYDRLLLVGDVDPRYVADYTDTGSPYVIFDVPYDVVVAMAGGVKVGRAGVLHLTTNPNAVKSIRAKTLFQHYQVGALELERRYGHLRVSEMR